LVSSNLSLKVISGGQEWSPDPAPRGTRRVDMLSFTAHIYPLVYPLSFMKYDLRSYLSTLKLIRRY
jgi:hypothetical protein